MSDYETMRIYCDDLLQRIAAHDEWVKRHPDHLSVDFRREWRAWADEGLNTFTTTFNPDDIEPPISDVLTSQRFAALMSIALAAYEKTHHV